MIKQHSQEDAVRSLFWQMLGSILAVSIMIGGSALIQLGVDMMSVNLNEEYELAVVDWTQNWLPQF